MKTFSYVLGIVTLFVIASCEKEGDLPDAGGTRLDQLIFAQTGVQQQILTQYNYDAENRLSEMVNSFVDSSNYTTRVNITYNGSGKLESFLYNNFKDGDQCTVTFDYNGEGQIVKKHINIIDPDYHQDDATFAYDAAGHMIADTFYYNQSSDIRGYHTFAYDGNGNIIKMQYYNDENHDLQFELKSTQDITYNDKTSPFLPMAMALNMIENSPLYLSPNNPEYEDILNVYTYYSNGLVRRLVSGVPNKPDLLITQDFYYK